VICRFCHIAAKSAIVNSVNSGVSEPNVYKIVHNVVKFILFNIFNLNFDIAIRFVMAVRQEIVRGKTPIFRL